MNLKQAIQLAGTQQEFALRMNVTQQAVSKWLKKGLPNKRVVQFQREMRVLMSENRDLNQLEQKVIEWARVKGILDNGTREGQAHKTIEEANELLKAVIDDDEAEIVDAIGDVCVTIIIQARMNGWSLGQCLESAYNVIAARSGKIVDGVFVKDK
jgi:predicted transcriptional regulator